MSGRDEVAVSVAVERLTWSARWSLRHAEPLPKPIQNRELDLVPGPRNRPHAGEKL
jgi:hypothetical protein